MSTLHFVKGKSQEDWGAMQLTLTKGANVSRVIWQMSQDGWTCVPAKEFRAWCKQHTMKDGEVSGVMGVTVSAVEVK